MLTVDVNLGDRSYPVYIGAGLIDQADFLSPYIKGRQVLIVSNEVVAPLYLNKVRSSLSNIQCDEFVLPDGENTKSLDTIGKLVECLLTHKHERSTTLIALGGGVVGDITGFTAACYQRGVNFIQIPTTLLAQVDSSVGGKTGVNHPLGKNMIGAFYQPQCVMIDPNVLQTLPAEQLKAGMAEVLKYGLINDSSFFYWLAENASKLLEKDSELLSRAIKICCESKASIVSADEKEEGVRALLNLGHTFGHAIENAMGYGAWLHGEAVAAGMVMSADLSMRLGWMKPGEAAEIKSIISAMGLPVQPPDNISVTQFIELMSTDKKVQNSEIRFILLQGIGKAVIESTIDSNILTQTLQAKGNLCQL